MSDQSISDPDRGHESTQVADGPKMLPGEPAAYDVAAEQHARFGSPRNRNLAIVAIVVIVAIVAVLVVVFWTRDPKSTKVKVNTEAGESGHEDEHAGDEVTLSPEALTATAIEIEGVTQRPAVAMMRVTGTVETNQQQSQQATPLVSGRVERGGGGPGGDPRDYLQS
jgi:hypothetical protein